MNPATVLANEAANIKPSKFRLRLPPLWDHQKSFVEDASRYTVCVSATKCGKTTAGALWLSKKAAENPKTLWWWVGPTFDMALPGYKTVVHLLGKAVRRQTERPWVARLWNGAVVMMKTAQEPEHLRGAGLNGGVLDEAGTPTYDKAWPIIRTTITATKGPLKIIGNPGDKGGFFWKAVAWARDPLMPDWSYHQWNFLDRPTATKEELEEARRELTEYDFRKYYLGEFVDEDGSFFSKIEECFVMMPTLPKEGHPHVIGVDPAIKTDFFVASVWDERDREQREVSRYKGPPTEQQVQEVKRLAKKFNDAAVLIEVNGPGGPLYQELAKQGVRVYPFETTGKSKGEILQDYRVDMAYGRLKALKDDVQIKEHYAFQAMRSANGFKYGAPVGEHDDTVMANAIANNGMRRIVSAEVVAWL